MKKTLFLILFLAAGTVSAQPSFPRVDPDVQAVRDNDRAAILLQERADETKALEAAEKALTGTPPGEKEKLALAVGRHRMNLAALDAEIQRAGGAAVPAVAVAGPVRLKARAASPAAVPADTPAPYWDVHRRREPQSQQPSDAAATSETVPYWDVFRRTDAAYACAHTVQHARARSLNRALQAGFSGCRLSP